MSLENEITIQAQEMAAGSGRAQNKAASTITPGKQRILDYLRENPGASIANMQQNMTTMRGAKLSEINVRVGISQIRKVLPGISDETIVCVDGKYHIVPVDEKEERMAQLQAEASMKPKPETDKPKVDKRFWLSIDEQLLLVRTFSAHATQMSESQRQAVDHVEGKVSNSKRIIHIGDHAFSLSSKLANAAIDPDKFRRIPTNVPLLPIVTPFVRSSDPGGIFLDLFRATKNLNKNPQLK